MRINSVYSFKLNFLLWSDVVRNGAQFRRNEVELKAEGAGILHPVRPEWTALETKGEVKVEP